MTIRSAANMSLRQGLCCVCGALLLAVGCGDDGGPDGTTPVPRSWTAPLDFGSGCVGQNAAIDAEGNAIVCYVDEATYENCLARYRPSGSDWGELETMNIPASEYVSHIGIGMDDAGSTLAVWCQSGTVYANGRTIGGWGTPEALHTDTDTICQVALSVSGDGCAVAAWIRGGFIADFTVKGSVYTPGAGWSSVEDLGSGTDDPSMIAIHTAIDGPGRAYVAWRQNPTVMDDTGTRFAKYVPGAGWSVEVVIQDMMSLDPVMAPPQNLVASPDGELLNGWMRYYDYGTGEEYRVWTQLYDPETDSWGPSEFLGILPPPTYDIRDLHVAAGAGNRFAAIWRRDHSSSRPEVIMTVRPDDPWGWRGIRGVESEKAPVWSAHPKVGVDSDGNLLAVWWHETGGGGGQMRARRWVEGVGFEDEVTIGDGHSVNRVSFDSNASGAAVVVWNDNVTRQIHASVYE